MVGNRRYIDNEPVRLTRVFDAQLMWTAGLDAFDQRYIIYRVERNYWLYGVEENRKAFLYGKDGSDLAW